MTRRLALTAVLALTLAACSRQASPPAAAPAAAAAPSAGTAASPAAPAAIQAPAGNTAANTGTTSAQSETEQATGAQESAGGGAGEKPESSDTSLERMTALPADAQLPAGRWKPGVQYEPLVPGQPTSVEPGKVEVLEMLWLGSPNCYALEPAIRAWLRSRPAWIEFARVPVMWNAQQRAHARLFYTLLSLGRADLVDKAFDTIQLQHNPLIGPTDEESLRIEQAWAAQQGIGAADYASAWRSAAVSAQLERAEDLTLRYRIRNIPTLIVNGKYETDVPRAGSLANLMQLIDDLAASEHRH
ncbi:MAG: thiol:disulfide interchange protein DsbA/DsbL [Gammaproteobacteria bacterium]|nr:thiol:disulfide interchange protein DsbA/DsbL [Gammaproteobacteria bacterium]